LLCGDLFAHTGNGPAVTASDVVGAALEAEDLFGASSLTPATGPTIRRLAALAPATLALMHGSSHTGNCAQALSDLAEAYDNRIRAALA
jgi:hypothetical protein